MKYYTIVRQQYTYNLITIIYIESEGSVLLDQYLIEHCSPTLAGLKTANLFCYPYHSENHLNSDLKNWNTLLNKKGIYITILRRQNRHALIYVYRKALLQKDFNKEGVLSLLKQYGYSHTQLEKNLQLLSQKLSANSDFPHEIGLFLGYPLGDVIGFIQNEGKNSKYTGCWKVYCDECEAIRIFEKFKKCKAIYSQLFRNGRSIFQLTVAA